LVSGWRGAWFDADVFGGEGFALGHDGPQDARVFAGQRDDGTLPACALTQSWTHALIGSLRRWATKTTDLAAWISIVRS
jgi:hypothetical protein